MSKEAKKGLNQNTALPSFSLKNRETKQQANPVGPIIRNPIPYNYRRPRNQPNSLESSTTVLNAFLNRNSINSLLLEYNIKTITDSTGNFNEENCLGLGSFGKVYKGNLFGTLIAVKVLYSPKKDDFMQEVSALSKYRHPNLVMLMGYAMHQNIFYLIFEYISNGDLRDRLAAGDLDWKKRISIMVDTATGLSYLHNSEPRCFHRDVKSSNILISESGAAKVADFGLARLASASKNYLKVKESAGTIGYADPCYVRTRTFSEASEVYSFGMLLFEILTSRPPAERKEDGKVVFLINFINGKLENILRILDTNANFPCSVITDISNLALRCTNDNPENRPKFLDIIIDLKQLLLSSSYIPEPVRLVASETSELENFSDHEDNRAENQILNNYKRDQNYNNHFEETSLSQITHFRNPDAAHSPIDISLDESVKLESYPDSREDTAATDNVVPYYNISDNLDLSVGQDLHVNTMQQFTHPTEQERHPTPIASPPLSDNEDEYDRMMYELSIQLSLDCEEARKIREIEDQRELQAAIEISKREF